MRFLFFTLLVAFLFESEKLFSQSNYNASSLYENNDYKSESDIKLRRKNFKWLNKIGFDSVSVEVGINDVYIIPHEKIPPAPCLNCGYRIKIKGYEIINFHFGLSSIDFLTSRITLTKGLLIIRDKVAFDYLDLYSYRYGYSKSSFLKFQIPLLLGINLGNFNLSSGANIEFIEFVRFETKEFGNESLNREAQLKFKFIPSGRANYIRDFKKFTAGIYLGADWNYKYQIYRKMGLMYFIK